MTTCRRCPSRHCPTLAEPYGILVTGVGGTGVVTIGALLGMAAHLEGKGVAVLDQLGMAQKGGAVLSHVRIADKPDAIHAVRIAAGGARLLLGCDLVVSAGAEALSRLHAGTTRAVVNSHEIDHRRLHPQPRPGVPEPRPASATSPPRSGRAAPSSSTRRGSRPGCSAIRSRPICSCSAMPTSRGWCRYRPRRSSGRSS